MGRRRRSIAASVVVPAAVVAMVVTVAGCSDSAAVAPPSSPADLVLAVSDLPAGFRLESVSVADLVAANQAGIDAARTTRVTPDFCRPTADEALNPKLSDDNAAVLGARGPAGVLVELVTSAARDIDADRVATTGRCARTTTEITTGNLAGSRVVTEYTELPQPKVPGGLGVGEQVLLTRSEVTTNLPDGGVRRQTGYAGYAALDRPSSGPVTVQLTVAGETTPASNPPTAPVEPLDPAAFTKLFSAALERVVER
ncbi:hypothetical protein [Gordonia aurantiaca]|uniref:hypothetical protein n=1 Tax=Gordonia sp. B21 TaxID=3151852 RepID=UPI003262D281